MKNILYLIFSIIILITLIGINNAQQNNIYYDSSSGNYIIEYIGQFIYIRGIGGTLRLCEGEKLQEGEEFVYRDSLVKVIFEPGTKINPKINCIVTYEKPLNSYLYSYILENGANSKQKLARFILEFGNVNVKNRTIEGGWINQRQKETHNGKLISVNRWAWSGRPGISPSFTYKGCALESAGLPGIKNSYFQGYVPILTFPTEAPGGTLGLEIAKLLNFPANYIQSKTISPVAIPDPFSAEIFLDTLIYYNQQSNYLEWISDSSTTGKYTNYFENAKSHIQQNNNPAAIGVLDSVLTDVEADSGITLTSEAYALIKYNTEYLRDHLEREQK